MKLSERIYRMLLKAYPARYRQHYEAAMAQLFTDQLRAAATPRKFLRLWLRTLADFVRTLPARYLEAPRSSYGFGAWSTPARRSVFFARYEASSFGSREITAEHLLLGILREDPPVPKAAVEAITREIEAAEANPRRTPPMEDLPISFNLRAMLEVAKEEASRSGAGDLTTRHLLAALVRKEDSLASRLLLRHSVDLNRLRSGK